MSAEKLTKKACRRFIKSRAAAGKRGLLNDGGGLYLAVGGSTSSWLFRYERGGKRHDMGLGPCHTFSLEEAREKARLARQLLYNGGDPLTEKKRAKPPTAVAKPASK